MALGGAGKSSATLALNSMGGMMKGWQQGRSDLWKKEKEEFDKNMAKVKAVLEDAYKDADRAMKTLAYNRQEAEALAGQSAAKLGGQVLRQVLNKQGVENYVKVLDNVYNDYKAVEKQLADMIELRKTQPNQVERVQSLLADDSFTSIATLCAEAAAQRKSLNSDALEVLEKNASSRTQETKKSSAKIQLSPSATRINENITRHFQTLVDDIAMAATLSDYEGGSPNPSAKTLLTKEIASRIGKKTVDDAFQKRANHVLKLWSSANPKLNADIMQLTSAGTRTAPGGDDLDAARNAAKSNITAAKDKLAGLFKNFPRTTAGQISAEIKRLDTALANS